MRNAIPSSNASAATLPSGYVGILGGCAAIHARFVVRSCRPVAP